MSVGVSAPVDLSGYMDKPTYVGITRSLFVALFPYSTGIGGVIAEPYGKIQLAATGQKAYGHFVVPKDYDDTPALKLVWISEGAADTVVVNTTVGWGSDDEPYNVNTETDIDRAISLTTQNDIGIDDLGIAFANLTIGDIVAVKVDRDATTTTNFGVLGIMFEYKALQ